MQLIILKIGYNDLEEIVYKVYLEINDISNKYGISKNQVQKAVFTDEQLSNEDAQNEVNGLAETLKEELEKSEGLGDGLGRMLYMASYGSIGYVAFDNSDTVLIGYDGYTDLTATKQIQSKEEFTNTFDADIVDGKYIITGVKNITSNNLVVPSTIYDNQGNITCVQGIAPNGLQTPVEIDMKQFSNQNYYVENAYNQIFSNEVSLETCANTLNQLIQNSFSVTKNVFDTYIQDGIDGSTTSLDLKLKYVGYKAFKLLIESTRGSSTISDSTIDNILKSVSDDVFYSKQDGHIYAYILLEHSMSKEAFKYKLISKPEYEVKSITMYLLQDKSFIGFSKYPDYSNASGEYVCPTMDNITIVTHADICIGTEAFNSNENTDFLVVIDKEIGSGTCKIEGEWRYDSITWGILSDAYWN